MCARQGTSQTSQPDDLGCRRSSVEPSQIDQSTFLVGGHILTAMELADSRMQVMDPEQARGETVATDSLSSPAAIDDAPGESAFRRLTFLLVALAFTVGFGFLVLSFSSPAPGRPGVDENAYLVGGRMIAEHQHDRIQTHRRLPVRRRHVAANQGRLVLPQVSLRHRAAQRLHDLGLAIETGRLRSVPSAPCLRCSGCFSWRVRSSDRFTPSSR